MATPFIGVAAAPYLISAGAVGGYFVGDKADQENIEREKRLEENQRYKDTKGDIGKQEQENTNTETAINTIIAKLNNNIPRQPNETDEYLKQQLIIHQSQLDSGKNRLSKLRNELDSIRKELGGNNNLMSLLGLNKLDFTEKAMIVAGIVLVIYLLKS
jgi:hypothetical protein